VRGAVIVLGPRRCGCPFEDPVAGSPRELLLLRAAQATKLRRASGRSMKTRIGKGLAPDQGAGRLTSKNGATFPPGSVLSGLTVEELRDGNQKAAQLVAELKRSRRRCAPSVPRMSLPCSRKRARNRSRAPGGSSR